MILWPRPGCVKGDWPRGGRAGGREGARARRRGRQGGRGRRCVAHSVWGRSSRRWHRGKSFCSQIFASCTVSFCIDCGAGLMVGCRCCRNRCCRRDGAFRAPLSPSPGGPSQVRPRQKPATGRWRLRLGRALCHSSLAPSASAAWVTTAAERTVTNSMSPGWAVNRSVQPAGGGTSADGSWAWSAASPAIGDVGFGGIGGVVFMGRPAG
jgi:hypothetical protein